MELQKLEYDFTVCQIDNAGIGQIDFTKEFVFLSKTDDEISLVCESCCAPSNTVALEAGWKALKIAGVLNFEMIGVITKIANILSDAGVSIFVISTYNTDYILVKAENFEKSAQALMNHGYTIK